MSTKRALINTEEQDAQEGWMFFPLAEEMMRANTVEHKLNPQTAARHEGRVAKTHVGLHDERNASREGVRLTRYLSRHSHHRLGRCSLESRRTGAPTSKCARLADGAAATPPEVRQESARDKTVLTNMRKAHSDHDKFQRDAKSVIAKSMECSTTQGFTVERDDVLRAASRANELAE